MVAVYVLYLLKNHLNFFYKSKRKGIIFAVVVSLVARVMKVFYNFFPVLKMHELKGYFDSNIAIGYGQLSYGIIISLIFRLMPIFVMVLNIQVIYFTSYIKNLMKGCKIGGYLRV